MTHPDYVQIICTNFGAILTLGTAKKNTSSVDMYILYTYKLKDYKIFHREVDELDIHGCVIQYDHRCRTLLCKSSSDPPLPGQTNHRNPSCPSHFLEIC